MDPNLSPIRRVVLAVVACVALAVPASNARADRLPEEAKKTAPTSPTVGKAAPAVVPAAAVSSVKRPHLTATLITDLAGARPGQTLRVGVHYKMDPHWHIYWLSPGEAGVPTKLSFDLPDGWDRSELRWPTPTNFSTGTIKGVGYVDEVVLFTDVRVPESALEGTTVRLAAKTAWLVCKDSCVRGRANLALDVMVRAEPSPSASKALFDKYAPQVPKAQPETVAIKTLLGVDGVTPGLVWQAAVAVTPAGSSKTVEPVSFFASGGEALDVKEITQTVKGAGVPKGGFLVRIAGKASDDKSLKQEAVTGVLVTKIDGKTHNIAVDFKVPRLADGAEAVPSSDPLFSMVLAVGDAGDKGAGAAGEVAAGDADGDSDEAPIGFMLALLFAFVGGVILNGMPCVLPVLSIKIMSLVEQSSEEPRQIRNHSWAYTAGILVTFGIVAAIMLSLGRGLGALNQYVAFNAWLGAIMLAFALSLFGVFEIVAPGANAMNNAVGNRHGYSSSFTYGMFAVLLGTPCTAPFLAPAIGAAVGTLAPVEGFIVILMAGVGLAFPFLLIGHFPAWSKWIPKPGAWMDTFKKLMGFALVATALWMIEIVSHQTSRGALIGYLVFLGIMSLAVWVYGHWGNIMRTNNVRMIATVVALAMIVAGQVQFMGLAPPAEASTEVASAETAQADPIVKEGEIQWRDFVKVDVEELARQGSTVFIDFTAAWCATCKVYEANVIDTETIRNYLVDNRVIPVKADWTNEDPKITQWLKRFNRAGVPMFLIIPANRPDQPIKLKDHLTTERMLKGLRKAGPSTFQVSER